MKKLPKKIRRIDDGEVFSLNEDGKTYSLEESKRRFPNALHNQYTFDTLIVKNKDYFEEITE